jgi:hypothetical protein
MAAQLTYCLLNTVLGVLIIVCLIALFLWIKWGFYGYAAITIVASITNMMLNIVNKAAMTGVLHLIAGLCGIAILYGVLQIGGEHKGWNQLV